MCISFVCRIQEQNDDRLLAGQGTAHTLPWFPPLPRCPPPLPRMPASVLHRQPRPHSEVYLKIELSGFLSQIIALRYVALSGKVTVQSCSNSASSLTTTNSNYSISVPAIKCVIVWSGVQVLSADKLHVADFCRPDVCCRQFTPSNTKVICTRHHQIAFAKSRLRCRDTTGNRCSTWDLNCLPIYSFRSYQDQADTRSRLIACSFASCDGYSVCVTSGSHIIVTNHACFALVPKLFFCSSTRACFAIFTISEEERDHENYA